jgi:histidine triad (HIT) family protein
MSSDPSCIFCKIIAGAIPCFKVFEDAGTLAFMDINPANPGHCLVIPRSHHPTLFETPPEVLGQVMASVHRVATAVQAALAPDGINLVQANGKGAEQSVFHFHMHIIPRRVGDGLKMNWGHRPGDMAAIGAAAEKIKAAL